MPHKLTIKDISKIARHRRGKCLDKVYTNARSPLRFQCDKGHEWVTAPYNVRAGRWCPTCQGRSHQLGRLKDLAATHGGKCLSKSYKGSTEKHSWACAAGHYWNATPNDIKRGRWCSVCAKTARQQEKLAAIVEIAKSHGGECLSSAYIDNKTKLKFKCAGGHTWSAVPYSIQNGTWCPECYRKRVSIDDMRLLAADLGGKCISKRYSGASKKLRWECERGHVWMATPSVIKAGSWCPECANQSRYENRDRLTIDEMYTIAESRNGRCLSKDYVNANVKLEWQCEHGHRWFARPGRIKQGTWCPECAKPMRGAKPLGIEAMQAIAVKRGGKCLSKEYVNNRTRLTWQCKHGHTWVAEPGNIKKGSWCPTCWRKGLC